MRELFAFIYRYRGFLVFALLETLCAFLIVSNNPYQGAAFFSSANRYVGQVLAFETEVKDYFRLAQVNQTLSAENAALRQELQGLRAATDSVPAAYRFADSLEINKVIFRPAKVVNNSIRRVNNFITLDAGSRHGIKPGMGVITKQGVVGRVKAVSDRFATVTSLLHSQMLLSGKLKKDNTFGSISWNGSDYRTVQLNYIPLHIKVQKGDSVVTSGYTGVFPEGVLIGTVQEVARESDKNFYTIQVQLAADFAGLSYVYVLQNIARPEQDSLEAAITAGPGGGAPK